MSKATEILWGGKGYAVQEIDTPEEPWLREGVALDIEVSKSFRPDYQ